MTKIKFRQFSKLKKQKKDKFGFFKWQSSFLYYSDLSRVGSSLTIDLS